MTTYKKINDNIKEGSKSITYDEATKYLEQSDYHVKSALVMILADVNFDEAKARLEKSNGFVRRAIKS